jgi:hypothetical protein
LNIHVIGDYLRILHFLKKIDHTNKKKEYYEKLFKEKGKNPKKVNGSLCWKTDGAPLKDYYA